jgi:hypothetical protein
VAKMFRVYSVISGFPITIIFAMRSTGHRVRRPRAHRSLMPVLAWGTSG